MTDLAECPSHCTPGTFFFFLSSSPIFRPIRVSSIPKISVRLSARYLRWVPICIPSANTSSSVFFCSTCFFCSSLQRGSRRPENETKIKSYNLFSGMKKMKTMKTESRVTGVLTWKKWIHYCAWLGQGWMTKWTKLGARNHSVINVLLSRTITL